MADLTVDALGELTSPAANDEIGIWDVSAGQYLKIQRSTLVGATITGGGTIALGGYTLTVPATGTAVVNGGTANVGIGVSPTTALHIVATNPAIRMTANAASGTSTIDLGDSDGIFWQIIHNASNQLEIKDSGNSGIVAMKFYGGSNGGNVAVTQLSGSGNRAVYSDSNGIFTNTASDERMKTDVMPIDNGESLIIVESLRPVRYRWNEELRSRLGEQVEIGLIAQEVFPHAPEVIGVNSDKTLSLDYARLVPVLIGSVQALSARIAALETQSQ